MTYQFKGRFKELKGKGYRFWKAFARNYKVYTKDFGSRSMHVWVAHGGYIEYNDLYDHSFHFFETLKTLKEEDFYRDRIYLVFEWDDCKKKPQVHTLSRMLRANKILMKKHGSDILDMSNEEQTDGWEKVYDELDGGKDMHEVLVTKEHWKELIDELKLINSY